MFVISIGIVTRAWHSPGIRLDLSFIHFFTESKLNNFK